MHKASNGELICPNKTGHSCLYIDYKLDQYNAQKCYKKEWKAKDIKKKGLTDDQEEQLEYMTLLK